MTISMTISSDNEILERIVIAALCNEIIGTDRSVATYQCDGGAKKSGVVARLRMVFRRLEGTIPSRPMGESKGLCMLGNLWFVGAEIAT